MKAFATQDEKLTALTDEVAALKTSVADLGKAVWNGGIVSDDTTFGGLVTFNSHVTFSGDNAGSVVIPAGQTTTDVTFKASMGRTPKVVATPGSFINGQYKIVGRTTAGFTIELQQTQSIDTSFDWHAFEASP